MLEVQCARSPDELPQNLVNRIGWHAQRTGQFFSYRRPDGSQHTGRRGPATICTVRGGRPSKNASQFVVEPGAGMDSIKRSLLVVVFGEAALVAVEFPFRPSIGHEWGLVAAVGQPSINGFQFF